MNKNINYEKRKLIELYYAKNWTAQQIAKRLGLSPSTVYRELERGNTHVLDDNGRSGYSALQSQEQAEIKRKNRGRRKLVTE